ncbi:hypothetical protein PYCC9005_004210 [Savitreella phatthalungensis]
MIVAGCTEDDLEEALLRGYTINFGPSMELFFLRHGQRLDQKDLSWRDTSPTPYDTPLSAHGFYQAQKTGHAILEQARNGRFVIHTSPFLRCIQTAVTLACVLPKPPTLRIDSGLGEWLTPDYYQDIQPPPAMRELSESARQSALQSADRYKIDLDLGWDSEKLGRGGDYGEEWPEMHARFRQYFLALSSIYQGDDSVAVILVTHGAGCNALLGAASGKPVLQDIGLCALSHVLGRDVIAYACARHLDSRPSSMTSNEPVLHRSSSRRSLAVPSGNATQDDPAGDSQALHRSHPPMLTKRTPPSGLWSPQSPA